ncbi:FYN-binding protein 1-like isoform X3 [Scomber scombrus]|uniref:FYN-binding protein 1-like isoform X3 n=1 Tax=Scomber scombrus TaxID=13677 RepID=A0AAV1MU04_SCOSC
MQTSDQESHTAYIGLMTQFNETGKSMQDASSKLAVQQKDCDVSSVRGIVSTLKQNLSCDAYTASSSHTPKPELRSIFAATPLIVNLGSSSLRHTDTSFKPSLSKNALMKSQKLNNTTTFGSQNKFQLESTDPSVPMRRSLPDILNLGSPPSKPDRPPVVNIDRFGRNRTSLNDGQGMKIPRPPLHSCPSSNQAAALCQQLVDEEIYDDCITNPPPVPPKGQSSNRTETDQRKKMKDELAKIWTKQAEESKTHQESNSRKEDTNKAAEKKQAEPKGTTGSEEMKGKDIKAKKREKTKLKKQQKVKEKKEREAKKFQIKKPVHETEKGKGRGKEITHNADDYVQNERVDTSHSDLKQYDGAQSKEESEDYDDIGTLVDSGLEAQNLVKEDDIYDDIDDLETRCDIYDDIGEDCL